MLDHHGLANFVMGNVLYSHVSGEKECKVLPGDTIAERLEFLNADIQAYYKAKHASSRLPPVEPR